MWVSPTFSASFTTKSPQFSPARCVIVEGYDVAWNCGADFHCVIDAEIILPFGHPAEQDLWAFRPLKVSSLLICGKFILGFDRAAESFELQFIFD